MGYCQSAYQPSLHLTLGSFEYRHFSTYFDVSLIAFACSIFFGSRVCSIVLHQWSSRTESCLHKIFKIRIFIWTLLFFSYWTRLLFNTSYLNTRNFPFVSSILPVLPLSHVYVVQCCLILVTYLVDVLDQVARVITHNIQPLWPVHTTGKCCKTKHTNHI